MRKREAEKLLRRIEHGGDCIKRHSCYWELILNKTKGAKVSKKLLLCCWNTSSPRERPSNLSESEMEQSPFDTDPSRLSESTPSDLGRVAILRYTLKPRKSRHQPSWRNAILCTKIIKCDHGQVWLISRSIRNKTKIENNGSNSIRGMST